MEESDEKLFSEGACHVFADELVREFADLHYRFRRLDSEPWNRDIFKKTRKCLGEKYLVHVYAGVDGIMIDVRGVQYESEFLEEYLSENLCPGIPIETYEKPFPRYCTRAELFEAVLDEGDSGVMNRDRLYLDPGFIVRCRRRARRLISSNRDLYDIRLLPNWPE